MIRIFTGSITFILVVLNGLQITITTIIIGLFRYIPYKPFQIFILKVNEFLADYFLYFNSRIQDLMQSPTYEVFGEENLKDNIWQFTTLNHLSWADIFLFCYFTNHKTTTPRIFMKSELWWLPITWAANIALAMPYVKRRSKDEIIKNPKLAETDRNATLNACKIFKLMPTNVCGFIEGTRIDQEKYAKSKSKFKNLMPPKIGGMGYTLGVMPYIEYLTDITLVYKSNKRSFWSFLCGDMNEASVTIKNYKIPENLRGKDYINDNNSREELRSFLELVWKNKDEIIEKEKERYGIKSVF